ncbi:carboxymuconolactone decarboxylase family protein [Streptococcus troglodytae]|uniref:Carboxymuconolactone decarboxylase family protein n=1 Tax=Streptococcus troglodytae TaxID=1111760 RepID=A0A1L7LJV9_9STRE|nr:carboxymuconolactone decarboxylase family protein [Streptococcus troglodytae]BAQ24467.1 carboxymuconolactone decarboxylase family protein [Streptococcus troglodytae]
MTDKHYTPNLDHLFKTDSELKTIIEQFAFAEVPADTPNLDNRRRYLSHLAVLLGSQAVDLFSVVLPAALKNDVTPREAKEVIYQAVAYLGLGRVYPFIEASNAVFKAMGIDLPLDPAGEIELGTRLEKGEAAQVAIFGEGMREFADHGDEASPHINKWLVDNCFGDYYTRTGLSYAARELMTFCYLYAQGGCENQLRAHTAANFKNGNNAALLIDVVSANVPYMGYPRSLNALAIIKEVVENQGE